MGDFNLDLRHYDSHHFTQEFLDSLFPHMLIPLITKPTRVTSHSATLIDNIFTNCFQQNILNGLILNDISDHFPVFAYFKKDSPTRRGNEVIYKRDYAERNLLKFQTALSQVNWSSVLIGEDPNGLYNDFVSEYNRHLEECFPLKMYKPNSYNKPKTPWISKALLVSVRKKNKLYKKYMTNPTIYRERKYKEYKNKLNHLIRIAKRTYYDTKFEQAKSDLKTTWKLINEVINIRKKKSFYPTSFNINNNMISDPKKIADEFCQYFTNVGTSLANKILPSSHSFESFLKPAVLETIFLRPTHESELREICMSFKNGRVSGYDNIPMHTIKNVFEFISKPLTHIINKSLENGVFPDSLKIAKIIPIFKSGDMDKYSNYRPISILANFSKFFEKVMHKRLLHFIEKLELLYCYQFGFRKKHSTELALIHLINKVATSIDENKLTAGVFLDLSKAFDTISHEILFYKLEHYGFRGIALSWIKSYFKNRKHFVQFGKIKSSEAITRCGVPQGSILGPLFFILYINDIPNSVRSVELLLFADDTSIYYSHNDPNVLARVMNDALQNVDQWMRANKLSINTDKTNYVIFKSRQKKITSDISLTFEGISLARKQQVKFLGIYLDENLSWKSHINHVCKKISKSIGIIFRARLHLSPETKLLLYYTLIYPYLNYCNIIWSSTYISHLNRIFLLQKRAVRILTNSDFLAHTAPLFQRLKILDIYKINSFFTGKFMYFYYKQLLPPTFLHLFIKSNEVHSYNTRNAKMYRTHSCKTTTKQHTILFNGPKLWNSLPENIKQAETFGCFRNGMKKHLLDE